jgi:hypothetical protein
LRVAKLQFTPSPLKVKKLDSVGADI